MVSIEATKQRVNFSPLKKMLAVYGFVNTPINNRRFYEHLYQKGDLYVSVSASFDPRDAPFNLRVMIGEGSTEWIECDWNSIPLWKLVCAKSPNYYPPGKQPYQLDSPADLNIVLLRVCSDLEEFGRDFLAGDIQAFRQVR